jgi:hypothetical protein
MIYIGIQYTTCVNLNPFKHRAFSRQVRSFIGAPQEDPATYQSGYEQRVGRANDVGHVDGALLLDLRRQVFSTSPVKERREDLCMIMITVTVMITITVMVMITIMITVMVMVMITITAMVTATVTVMIIATQFSHIHEPGRYTNSVHAAPN